MRPIVCYQLLLLSLFLLILLSLFVFNALLFTTNYDNKIIARNICHTLTADGDDDHHYRIRYQSIRRSSRQKSDQLLVGDRRRHPDSSFVNISDNIFIYSAFEVDNHYLVLIGLAKKLFDPIDGYGNPYNNSIPLNDYQYLCGFNDNIALTTRAVVEYLPEGHHYSYSAVKVKCKKPKLFEQKLSINGVKLIERETKSKAIAKAIESQLVSITKSTANTSETVDDRAADRELVVCVRPLYGNISAIHLLEFIAYYRLNSVDKIVFYNSFSDSLTPDDMRPLMETLSAMSFVDVLPFVIPNNSDDREIVHARGQLTAVHDCLHRYADRIQIHVDFDEYLRPSKSQTIREFVSSPDITGWSALVVPTVIFCTEYSRLLADDNDYGRSGGYSSHPLLTSNFNRQKTVWPHEIRSKVVVMKPKLVSQMGIHNVWKLFHRKHTADPILNVPSDQLLVHHYRRCCHLIQPYFFNLIYFNTINDIIVKDESMKKFIHPIMNFINEYISVS